MTVLASLLVSGLAAEPAPHSLPEAMEPASHAIRGTHRKTLAARSKRLAPQFDASQVPQGRKLRVGSTAYCLRGYTASGTYVGPGTIAVDPRVIPLGTRVYVPGYGYAVARDTGGAIVGNKIDVWFPSLGQCYQWGYRHVTITVLDRPRRR